MVDYSPLGETAASESALSSVLALVPSINLFGTFKIFGTKLHGKNRESRCFSNERRISLFPYNQGDQGGEAFVTRFSKGRRWRRRVFTGASSGRAIMSRKLPWLSTRLYSIRAARATTSTSLSLSFSRDSAVKTRRNAFQVVDIEMEI